MLKIKDNVNLKELEKFGYEDLGSCYYKDTQPTVIGSPWVVRVDKKTKEVKYWNCVNGRVGIASKVIQDLIQAGLVKEEEAQDGSVGD